VEETKPAPDLVETAIEKAGSDDAVMLGDSVWDCEAAKRAGIETVAVMTGGFSEDELRDAGAVAVFESLQDLRKKFADTPFG
jgi:phosphoglycolate phosphatase-like HAD superfamily hydrolase